MGEYAELAMEAFDLQTARVSARQWELEQKRLQQPVKCPHCESTLKLAGLNDHIRDKHPDHYVKVEEPPQALENLRPRDRVKCPYCDAKPKKMGLSHHVRDSHPDQFLEFEQERLRQEAAVPKGPRQRVQCPHCDARPKSVGLQQHMQDAHPALLSQTDIDKT